MTKQYSVEEFKKGAILVSFELTMPNRNSAGSRWSGQDNKYYIVKKFTSRRGKKDIINLINADTYYSYCFGDGWRAAVTLEIIDSKEARKRRKISSGFSGYDWMVDSIICKGEIRYA